MSSEKSKPEENISSKVKRSAKSIATTTTTSKKLEKTKVSPRSKTPELSVVNVIERISLLLRSEIHALEEKKVSGE